MRSQNLARIKFASITIVPADVAFQRALDFVRVPFGVECIYIAVCINDLSTVFLTVVTYAFFSMAREGRQHLAAAAEVCANSVSVSNISLYVLTISARSFLPLCAFFSMAREGNQHPAADAEVCANSVSISISEWF